MQYNYDKIHSTNSQSGELRGLFGNIPFMFGC